MPQGALQRRKLLKRAVLQSYDLKIFLAAYRHRGIGRAAEALGLNGSTVSRRLTSLEESLGQVLFVRSPDGLKPTDAALRLLDTAQDTEKAAQRLEMLASEDESARGLVRVATSSSVFCNVLLPNWRPFAESHPDVTVEFAQTPDIADMERWEADIAIRTARPTSGDNLVVSRLRDSTTGLFASAELLRRGGADPDAPESLQAHAKTNWAGWPFVDWAEDQAELPLARLRAGYFPQARVVLRARRLEALRLAASAGLGFVLLPSYFGMVSPNLVEVPAPHVGKSSALYLVGHSAVRHTARVDAVWRFLVEVLRGDDLDQVAAGKRAITKAYGVRFPD